VQNKRVIAFDAVHDDVFTHWKTTYAGAQIVRAPAADSGMLRQYPESVRDGVDKAVGNFDAAALARNVKPDAVKVGFRFR
jgi:hypothetical protein